MARVEIEGRIFTDAEEITKVLADFAVPYESWGVKTDGDADDHTILAAYEDDVAKLKQERQYVTADLVALSEKTPGLAEICAKFDKEHHHSEDEVRFTVAGEGVFEIETEPGKMLKFTSEPGDLIVIPANRRHSFYLTDKKTIRCIRLFKNQDGWAAIYDKD